MYKRTHGSGLPSYRLHRQSGMGIVTLVDSAGRRHDVLLGRHGTPESKAEYLRVVNEWQVSGCPPKRTGPTPDITVSEMLVRYWEFAQTHYRAADGQPTSEVNDLRLSLKPLRELYGHTFAKDFGPLSLQTVRQRMVDAGLCRGVVNQRIGRIKRCFKWAVANEIVPPWLIHGLKAVVGLQKGRSPARETPPVGPVPPEHVDAVLPLVLPPVRAMIELQSLTGCRPGEVCIMRPRDIDRSGDVWFFRPSRHKTEHRGKSRVVAIGPRGQGVVAPFLVVGDDEYVFSPARAVADWRAAMRATRKTRVQPSQRRRRKRMPKRAPGERYTTGSYGKAVAEACKKANVPAWTPNQLRHSHATTVRKHYGLEGAQVVLGHSQAAVTEIYAERDLSFAERIAKEIG